MPLFGKKKKGASDEAELEVMDKAENDKGDVKVKRKNPFSHIKKKFRLSLIRKNTSDADEPDSESAPDLDSAGGDGKKTKSKKKKKEKKPKEKKPKKPKKQKKKEPEDSTNDEGSKSQKKRKLILLIIIIAGSILVASVAAFIVIKFVINKPTTEQRLMEAQLLFNEQKYDKADKIYNNLIKKDETLVKAYIGRANILVASDNTEDALALLQEALVPTSDNPEILNKIEELAPIPEEEPDVASPATTAFAVSFSDPAFEKMLRMALKKSSSEQIMNTELEAVISLKIMGGTHAHATSRASEDADRTIPSINRIESYEIDGTVYTERGTIKNLNDLKHFTNLKKLIIGYNSVTDINGISGLENLDTLGLYCNDISVLSPLSSVPTIEYLYIYNNRISDISALSNLTGLRQLWLNVNNISDISPLKGLVNLTELFLNGNEIKDISAVADLKKLGFLYFDNNQVSDISAVKGLTALTDISFVDNPVEDFSPASHVPHINRSFF